MQDVELQGNLLLSPVHLIFSSQYCLNAFAMFHIDVFKLFDRSLFSNHLPFFSLKMKYVKAALPAKCIICYFTSKVSVIISSGAVQAWGRGLRRDGGPRDGVAQLQGFLEWLVRAQEGNRVSERERE